ncbi:DUF4277 domain-containing protein [Xenorhabdus ehlersii]|uniref:Transposase n=1 Tax=Xenorhabdus ehlersii TaxID=290111 RepID=A0A2D0IXF1_9GAMM|nr:transposase [Xenorhabdus ehlersii]
MSTPEPVIQLLEHLGIIFAFCHELRLPRMIETIMLKYADHHVSHGDVCGAGA